MIGLIPRYIASFFSTCVKSLRTAQQLYYKAGIISSGVAPKYLQKQSELTETCGVEKLANSFQL